MRRVMFTFAAIMMCGWSPVEGRGQGISVRVFMVHNPEFKLLRGSSAEADACRDSVNEAPQNVAGCGKRIVELPEDPIEMYRVDSDSRDQILVRAFDSTGNPVTMGTAKIAQVVVTVGTNPPYLVNAASPNAYVLIPLSGQQLSTNLAEATHGTPIEIRVVTTGGDTLAATATRWDNRWKGYGTPLFGSRDIGVWLPIGILATNFDRTNEGIEFSALPIGAAIGARLHTSNSFYLGVSGIGMYSIDSAERDSPDGAGSEKVTLSSLAAGGLIDVGGMLYLTVTRHFDFSGDLDARTLFGVGAGPELLRFIGAGKGSR